MAFYNSNTGDITFKDPTTGEDFVINTPVENYTWNSTPLTWTNVSTDRKSTQSRDSSSTLSNSTDIVRTGNSLSSVTTTDTLRSRRVIETYDTSKVTNSISSVVTAESSLIPFMRKRDIKFSATGMKPNAILVATFGDENVTEYCKQTSGSGTNKPGTLKASPTGTIEGIFYLPHNKFKAGIRLFKLIDKNDPTASFAEAKYTSAGRRVDITTTRTHETITTRQRTINDTLFQSKHTQIKSRNIAVPDGVENNDIDAWVDAGRPARPTGDGNWVWDRGNGWTLPPEPEEPEEQDNSVLRGLVGSFGRINIRNLIWRDPVAQSFYVETSETNRGVFIHSIDLYFFEVEPGHDVEVTVRHMKDGLPTIAKITDYSTARLNSSQIKTSTNGTKATRFTFPTPFFLAPNDEYCFVVTSTSNKTSLWCAELGKKSYKSNDSNDPSGEIIAKQPYLGCMFLSQNNTTWTPIQKRDLKFKINRAEFVDVGKLQFINKNKEFYQSPHNKRMKSDCLEFGFDNKNRNLVKLYAHGHGLRPGDKFKLFFGDSFRNQGNVFGININSHLHMIEHTVVEAHPTHLTFSVMSNAQGSGSAGGDEIWMLGWVVAYSYAQLIKNDMQLDGTFLSYKLSGREWNYYNNGQATGEYEMSENTIVPLPKVHAIKRPEDKGALIDVKMISDITKFTSPIIYADSFGIETQLNVINNIDFTDDENNKNDDSSPAKYIQKEVSLVNPANELKVFFESNLPYGASASVYYKTGPEEIETDTTWKKMEANDGDGIVLSSNENEWRTQNFKIKNLDEFKSFQIMIVLKSENRLVVPKVKNYRAIALYGVN